MAGLLYAVTYGLIYADQLLLLKEKSYIELSSAAWSAFFRVYAASQEQRQDFFFGGSVGAKTRAHGGNVMPKPRHITMAVYLFGKAAGVARGQLPPAITLVPPMLPVYFLFLSSTYIVSGFIWYVYCDLCNHKLVSYAVVTKKKIATLRASL